MTKKPTPSFPSAPRSAPRIHSISGIVLNHEGQSDLTFVRSPDISVRGMFISTTRHFPEGAILNVRFRLTLSGASVQVRGEVRYCLPGVGIGLEFMDLDAATRKLIDREVALNHPVHSPRKSRKAAQSAKPARKRRTTSRNR